MTPKPGDLLLVPFPFSNLKATKTRPVVVLSSTAYNAASSDLLVAAMTSNLDNTPYSVLVTGRDVADGVLAADSRVKVNKIATLDKGLVRKRIARLRPAVLGQVYKELLALLPASARA
jgi:mRNA interferase MazF